MRLRIYSLLSLALACLSTTVGIDAHAQSSSRIVTGVVVSVQTQADGALASFNIVDSDGETINVGVSDQSPNTAYGLENQVGDRWVSDHASEPVEAAVRIRDQQRRLTSITVDLNREGVANSIVQAESSGVESNLGYLFAAMAITWFAFVAYFIYMSRRQRILASEISKLREHSEQD